MPEITICTLKCIRSSECYRFKAEADIQKGQTYLAEPKKDCVEQDYKLFYKMTRRG